MVHEIIILILMFIGIAGTSLAALITAKKQYKLDSKKKL